MEGLNGSGEPEAANPLQGGANSVPARTAVNGRALTGDCTVRCGRASAGNPLPRGPDADSNRLRRPEAR